MSSHLVYPQIGSFLILLKIIRIYYLSFYAEVENDNDEEPVSNEFR